jgi:hypothetical protein
MVQWRHALQIGSALTDSRGASVSKDIVRRYRWSNGGYDIVTEHGVVVPI